MRKSLVGVFDLDRLGAWLVGGLVCAIILGQAVAQPGPPVYCTAASAPVPVIATGIAELLPDIVVRCVAGSPMLPAVRRDLSLALSVSLNASVTNRVGLAGESRAANAVLVVNGNDCPRPSLTGSTFGACGAPLATVQDPQYARLASTGKLEWSDVAVPFPGALKPDGAGGANPGISTLRIRGIRANATQLSVATSSSPAGPPISASVVLSSSSAVVLRNGTLRVAYPTPALGVAVASSVPAGVCSGGERGQAVVHLREGFADAFRSKEPGPSAGPVSRILLQFREVSNGVSVKVPSAVQCAQPEYDGARTGLADMLSLGLVRGHRSDGIGGSASAAVGSSAPDVELDLFDGTGQAVYEVVAEDRSQVEDCHVPVSFDSQSASDRAFHAKISAGLAPTSPVFIASEWAPVPRFAKPLVRLEETVGHLSCGTTLAFPFVTSQAGFTTGIVITPGSRQELVGAGAGQPAGPCDLHYYGFNADGERVLLVQHSTPVDPGDQLVFTLSGGNPAQNIVGTSQFQGYIMAVCSHSDVSGYAFISDGFGGIADLAMGYLAPAVRLGSSGKRQVLGNGAR